MGDVQYFVEGRDRENSKYLFIGRVGDIQRLKERTGGNSKSIFIGRVGDIQFVVEGKVWWDFKFMFVGRSFMFVWWDLL